MDKVNGANSQAMPLWERQKSQRGHYSSVDKALQAHRQRKAERQERVENRISMVHTMQNKFFPSPAISEQQTLYDNPLQAQPINNAPMQQPMMDVAAESPDGLQPPVAEFNPMQMDEIYKEASLGSVADNALGVVQKEMANPEDVPADEVPKGSYIDYTV